MFIIIRLKQGWFIFLRIIFTAVLQIMLRAERIENILWLFLAKEPAGAGEPEFRMNYKPYKDKEVKRKK